MRATPQGVKPCGSLHLREFSDYSTLREAEGVFPVMRLHRKVLQWIIEGMLKKTFKWGGIILLVLYIALVIYRGFVLWAEEKTNEQVAKIHATKLMLADVLGDNLPPAPENPDATVEGVDQNKNGIRDDVELAIFAEYPNSARTRLPLLQYALVLQMQMTLPIINMETVTTTVEDSESRADICLWTLSSRSDMKKFLADMEKYDTFVKSLQLNTEQRKNYLHNLFEGNLGSYASSNDGCDLNPSTLPN